MNSHYYSAGGVGHVHREPVKPFADPVTGKQCLRLTDPNTHCHHPYFYYRCFTPQGRQVLYISHRTGKGQAYLLDLDSGDATQLTDVEGLNEFIISVSRDGRFLFYSENNKLHRMSLDNFDDEIIYRQQPPYISHGGKIYAGFNEDDTRALVCQIHQEDIVTGKGWSSFEPQWRKHPRCRLVLVDLITGQEQVVHEEACWLGHPQIRPGAPDTLMFCHEGPSNLVNGRIWTIKPDGTACSPLVHPKDELDDTPNVIVSHECFMPNGRHVLYTFFPEIWGSDGSLRLYDFEEKREIDLGPVSDYSHPSPSPDSCYIAGDEARKEHLDVNRLWLFDIETHKETPVCLHGSSFAPRGNSTQDAHPHPAFTPDGQRILFTSDRETGPEGNCVCYLVHI